jgi:archaetidylserine synthase
MRQKMSFDSTQMKDFISLPDLFSVGNASFGFLSIIMAINGELILAAQFILIAVIFDSVDGWVARKTNRDDKFGFGKNIDSLCDIISFGIRYINIIVSLLIVICGILRLSRFNVISNMRTIQDKFVGLPIPATALLLSSFYLSGLFTTGIGLLIITLSSLLMISTVEYFKPKSVKTALIILILIISVCMPQNIQIMLMNIPAKVLFIISLIYIIFMPFMALFTNLKSGPHVR